MRIPPAPTADNKKLWVSSHSSGGQKSDCPQLPGKAPGAQCFVSPLSLLHKTSSPRCKGNEPRSEQPAYLVGVPEADGAAEGQLPHQQVVHPAEGELQVFDLVLPKVVMYLL